MASPTLDSINSNQGAAVSGVSVTLTNAPTAGGIVVVIASVFSGTGGGTWSCTNTGGTGITITERLNALGTANNTTGILIYTVEYSSAPTALSVDRSGSSGSLFMAVCCSNVSGQIASYLDVVSTQTSGTSTACVDTNLPNLTDSTSLVIGGMTRNGTTGTISPDAPWSQVVEIDESNATYQTLNVAKNAPGSTGAHDPAWTLTSSDTWTAGSIAIKGSSGGGGTYATAWLKA